MSEIKISLFSQVLSLIDRSIFDKIVKQYNSDKYSKGINTWTHLVSMLFMHMANSHSLRDISNGLKSATGNLNHMGITKAPSKSTISYINSNRSYEVFEQLYYGLLQKLEPSLKQRRKQFYRIKRKIFIMDSSLIPLCLSLFDWAKYRTQKGAAKLHAVLNYDLGLPSYAVITDGKTTDVKVAQKTEFTPNSVLVVDRAYADYNWFNNLDSNDVKFIIRIKKNVQYRIEKELPTNLKHPHIVSDQIIRLTGHYVSKKYPKCLRLIKVYDLEKDLYLEIITNNLSWTANTVSELYRARWDIEVFFRYLKQSFKLKSFVGTNPNAVRIQMWTSLITILLFNYLRKKAKHKWFLSNLVSFLRINLFVKIDLWQWLNNPILKKANSPPIPTLFD